MGADRGVHPVPAIAGLRCDAVAAVLRHAGDPRPAELTKAPMYAPDRPRAARDHARFGVGKVRFWRNALTAPGHQGLRPLDAELIFTAIHLLREWAVYGTTDVP